MGFKHPIDDVIYDVVWYRLDEDGHVDEWCVRNGAQEIPYDHMAGWIVGALEEQCRINDRAEAVDGAMHAAECRAHELEEA